MDDIKIEMTYKVSIMESFAKLLFTNKSKKRINYKIVLITSRESISLEF